MPIRIMGKCRDFLITSFFPRLVPRERRIQSNTFRLFVLWLVLVVIFLTAGLSLGVGKFYVHESVPVTDKMYYVDWFSNTFCSYVNVTTYSPLSVNAFIIDKDSDSRTTCDLSTEIVAGPITATIPAHDIYTMKVYRETGDRISGQICMSREETVYMFVGQSHIRDPWIYLRQPGQTYFQVESSCKDFEHFDHPFILPQTLISGAGEYYYVFYNSLSTSIKVSARFTKTLFNDRLLTEAQTYCYDKDQCKLDLGGASESKVACFEAINDTPSQDGNSGIVVKVICQPRLWMYMLVFLIIPIVIGISGTVLIFVFCKKTNQQTLRPDTSASSNNNRGIPIVASYDERENDVIRGMAQTAFSDPPPSYDEIFNGVIV